MTSESNAQMPKRAIFMLAAAVMLGLLAASFAAIFVNIAMPMMIDELQVKTANAHWLITVFIATATLFMLLASHFVSHFSVRSTFIAFLLIFIVASIIGGVLSTLWPIILCRAAQGASMGVLAVLALLALFEAYPVEKRGQAGAVFGLGAALGPTLGPTLSGIIVEYWGWRAIFFAPLPLAFGSLALSWKVLPGKVIGTGKSFDVPGFMLLSIALFGLLGGTSYLQQIHWPMTETLGFAAIMGLLLLALGWQEMRCPHPLLPLGTFRYRIFSAAAIVSFVYGMGLWGSAYILPLYLQRALGFSAMDTGLVMLPSGLVLCLMLPLGGRMTDHYPSRVVVIAGLLCFAISFLLLGAHVAGVSFAATATLIAMSRGLGLGIMIPGLDATATRALPRAALADGIAMTNFLRQLGGTLSPMLLMLLLQWRTDSYRSTDPEHALVIGYQQTLVGLGLLFLSAVIAAWQLRPSMQQNGVSQPI